MFRIYYTDEKNQAGFVDATNIKEAITETERLRKLNHTCVTMVATATDEQVGRVGVSSVNEGKLPDGSIYDWTKNDRVGASFRNR